MQPPESASIDVQNMRRLRGHNMRPWHFCQVVNSWNASNSNVPQTSPASKTSSCTKSAQRTCTIADGQCKAPESLRHSIHTLGNRVVIGSWIHAASATSSTSASLAAVRPYRMLYRIVSLNNTQSCNKAANTSTFSNHVQHKDRDKGCN